jgi:DNA polymerase I
MAERPLLIIDGDNLAHRAYHSTPASVKGSDDRPLNAVVGFFGMVSNLWTTEQPRAVFVAWDTLGVETYRHKLWPEYQTGRVFDSAIVDQLEVLPDLCRSFGFGVGKATGYEADDLMAAAVRVENGPCLLITSDKDAYQLVTDEVMVLNPRRGVREMDRIGPAQVVEKLGVLPEQIPDYKALAGDASDRIPGARGIGPKSAANLLLKYGDLEGVLAAVNRGDEVERLRKFREVVEMRPDVEVVLPQGPPDWLAGAEAVRALGAGALADRLAKLAGRLL